MSDSFEMQLREGLRPVWQSRQPPSGTRLGRWLSDQRTFVVLCGLATLLSAWLLFQVQPMTAKAILPWFGGGHAVWTTCLLFFQLALLAGYAYAFVLQRLVSMRRALLVHLAVLVAAGCFLPVTPSAAWKPLDGDHVALRILMLLTANVGLPYFLLASTSPLLQAWYAEVTGGRAPYRLYALSNLGSLSALLAYPFLVEPTLSLPWQSIGWAVAFVVFATVLSAMMAQIWHQSGIRSVGTPATASVAGGEAGDTIAWRTRLWWIGLSALGSAALLATSNQVCLEVAVVPLLWIVPLVLYLLSFIVCFDRPAWYVRWLWGLGAIVCLFAVIVYRSDWLLEYDFAAGVLDQINTVAGETALYSIALFAICMICHGELVASKPHSRHVTSFYVTVAGGGALGGAFISLVCPWCFQTLIEVNVVLAVSLALATWCVVKHWQHREGPALCWILRLAGAAVVAGGLYIMADYSGDTHGEVVQRDRNHYGVLSVQLLGEGDDVGKALYHGSTMHGFQYLDAARKDVATTYYDPLSGVGLTLSVLSEQKPIRVGVVGLGAGTLASYGNGRDHYHFYEINSDVVRLASSSFSYLRDSEAATQITLGDARLSLERQAPQNFDVLVLDAFSGDAIPVHLLTREAFACYARHLHADSVIAVHVSNRYLNLFPVVAQHARACGYEMVYIETTFEETDADAPSDWLLLTKNVAFTQHPKIVFRECDYEPYVDRHVVWTDQFSSLLGIMY